MKTRRMLLSGVFIFVLLAGILGHPGAMAVQASEWYVGALVGGSFPAGIDIRSKVVEPSEDEVTTFKTKNLDLNNSVIVGAKGGVCPGFFPYLCLELEFDHFWPSIGSQTVTDKGKEVDGGVLEESFSTTRRAKANIRVANLDPMLIARYAFLQAAGYPLGGRLHLYAGVGPALIWTTQKMKTNEFVDDIADNLSGKKDTDFSVGVAVPVGIKYFLTNNLAIFAEYKYKHWSPRFKFNATEEGDLQKFTTRTNMNANLVYFGLAWHIH